MKTHIHTSAERTQLAALIEPMTVVMMTTADDTGALASRPMLPLEMDASGALWFFTDLRSEKVEHLLLVNLAFSDEAAACYVSVSGRGEIHTDSARIERLWSRLAKPWFPDGPASTDLAALKIVPTSAEYWDSPNSKMVRMFAVTASVAAGRALGLGKHATLNGLAKSASASATA